MAHKKDKYVDHVLVRYTPLQAIKDAAGFVARFFKFSNLKHGFRSVIGGFREFFVFFFALSRLDFLRSALIFYRLLLDFLRIL